MNDPFRTLTLPTNAITLKEDESITFEQDCILQKCVGWLAITKPGTDELVTAEADGYFKAPVKVTGGHKGGTFTVDYRA